MVEKIWPKKKKKKEKGCSRHLLCFLAVLSGKLIQFQHQNNSSIFKKHITTVSKSVLIRIDS